MPAEKNALLNLADRCVKCGLCLPVCPTYQISGNEAESPRGRIALIEGLMRDNLKADATLWKHIDRCLLCRRCETHCPSGVAFANLMDGAHGLGKQSSCLTQRLRTRVLSNPTLSRVAIHLGQLIPTGLHPSPAHKLAKRTNVVYQGFQSSNTDHIPTRGRIGLFLGCVARTTQNAALHATQDLLNLAGYEVVIPKHQGCCGAMHTHQGLADEAQALIQTNKQAFANLELDAIVSLASGCGLQLQEAGQLPAPHMDISDFLAQSNMLEGLNFAPLAAKVLLHTPCTLANGLRSGGKVSALLQHIPELKIQPITDGYGCCGAAGTHLLTHREQAEQLRQPLLEDIEQRQPDYLLTSNPGCALHLATGCDLNRMEVLHPVQLLARQCTGRANSA